MTDTERLDRLEQRAKEWGERTGIRGGWEITASGTLLSNTSSACYVYSTLREAIDAMGGEDAK